MRKIKREDETIWDTPAVVDPGQGSPPLCLDQTEARRAQKNLRPVTPPLSQGLDDRPPPPPLSEGLDWPML